MSVDKLRIEDILSHREVWGDSDSDCDASIVPVETADKVDCSVNIRAAENSSVHVQVAPTPPRVQSPPPEEPPQPAPKPGIDQDHFDDIIDAEDPRLTHRTASCFSHFCYLCCTLACIIGDRLNKLKKKTLPI